MGCDLIKNCLIKCQWLNFNPRTHRGVRLKKFYPSVPHDKLFQSTHPSWGATDFGKKWRKGHFNFNPRTHRGVRLCFLRCRQNRKKFQSTHPSWGATVTVDKYVFMREIFQSTHPSWGATAVIIE